MNKLFIQRHLNFIVPNSELTCVLQYLGKTSVDLRTRLERTIERNLPYCKLKVIFRSKCRLNTLFRFKDSLEKRIRFGVVYRCTCSDCKVTYYVYAGVTEHMGISDLTGKRLKDFKQSAISDHPLQRHCAISFDNVTKQFTKTKSLNTNNQKCKKQETDKNQKTQYK